ncbi:MAG TPA: LD-carboxypeptidase [Kofleriaceae bacterium]|jgi:muramoyltetrapeptide carboxypeptidase
MSAERPPRIARGQTLGIVAPAGPVQLDRLRRGLDRLGGAFQLRIAESITAPRDPATPSYLAASDDVRAREFDAMLRDRDVRAILLARGGYGVTRILSRLDRDALRADPKPIVGFSDATALLSWAYAAGVRGIHGPVGVQLGSLSDADVAQLVTLLTEPRAPGVRPWSLAPHGRGSYRGPLFTGNLTMLAMLVGTPWALPLRGAIGLIEEVGERPYEIDRYLTQLTQSGDLAQLAAMIVGELTRCADPSPPAGMPDPPDAALRTVLERLHSAGTPAATGAPIGHGERNEAVPFGATSVLDLDANHFEILEPAVA